MQPGEGDFGERVVLSRGDTCLREADVELLRGPHWLNDQLVTFFFSHLAESEPDESALLLGGSVRTGLSAPISSRCCAPNTRAQVTFFLANCEAEDAAVITAPLSVDTRSLVLFALNDGRVGQANGGSHWTLLALKRQLGEGKDDGACFTHFDSLPQSRNLGVARRVAQTVASALRLPSGSARVEAARVPQQVNSYDCGLHALLTAQVLYQAHRSDPGRAPTEAELAAAVTPAAVSKLRGDIAELIARYAAEEAEKLWDD